MELSPQTLTILVLASLTLSVIAVIVLFATTASRRARGEAGPIHLDETLEGERILLREGIVQPGDRIVVVFGTTREAGMTNTMHIRTL